MTPRHEQVRQLLAAGRLDQARAAAQRLVQCLPRDALAAALMAEVCERANQLVQALHFAERGAVLAPNDAGMLAQAGRLAMVQGRFGAATGFLVRALEIEPDRRDARLTLIQLCAETNRVSEVERLSREGLERSPDDAALLSTLAGAMLNLARADEAAALLHRLRDEHPDELVYASGYSMMLNYVPGATPREQFEAHRRFGEVMERLHPAPSVTYSNSREPGRRVRVGIISPDLRAHSVAWFAAPLLRYYDRTVLEVFVYQTNYVSDAVTQRLRPLADTWRVMDTVNDVGLAQRVHDDQIDVLVELSGHTTAGSLLTMQLRPAPVAMTYLGYPNTTGLRTIDYRVVDSFTDPSGSEAFASERLLRLDPCFLCYEPPVDAPAVMPPPCAVGAGVTFGSFNSGQKLNSRVIGLWARVLGAVPGSRLLLKSVNFADAPLRAQVRDRFRDAGVAPDRLEIAEPLKGTGEHLSAYARVDIALDPLPYNGTTTTCEALWMGVPVVSLAGSTHSGRVGSSLLHAVGLEELVAADEDGYVAVAAGLAGDLARLSTIRAGLRSRVAGSVLCDGPMFCRRFEGAVLGAWHSATC